MATKHNLSGGDNLFYGRAYDAPLYGTNASKGVPVHLPTRVSLGSPIAPDTDALIVGCTSTNMPNNSTKTYSAAVTGVAAPCNDTGAPTITTITTSTGTTATVWPLTVARNITTATSTAAADTVFTITGYDVWKVKMVEAITIASGQTATAGKKAFAYVESIAIYSAGDTTTDTATVGFGDVLGLPYVLANKGDLISASFNGVNEAVATLTAAVATDPATATTGDVRGTVDMTSACNGSPIIVWMYVADPNTVTGLRGIAQYGG